jgi:hypothetical protein
VARITIGDLITKLEALPVDWIVTGTKSGSSLQADDPSSSPLDSGHGYAVVFTDERETRRYTRR